MAIIHWENVAPSWGRYNDVSSLNKKLIIFFFPVSERIILPQCTCNLSKRAYSSSDSKTTKTPLRKASTPVGQLDDSWGTGSENMKPQKRNQDEKNAYAPFPDDTNPNTGEIGGPKGPEPTRYGDWERKGRVIDF